MLFVFLTSDKPRPRLPAGGERPLTCLSGELDKSLRSGSGSDLPWESPANGLYLVFLLTAMLLDLPSFRGVLNSSKSVSDLAECYSLSFFNDFSSNSDEEDASS